jgi:hypothetical protein
MITLGGVTATLEEIAQVLDALYDAPGDHMKRYLRDTPLDGMDYHKVSDEELELFPNIQVAPGTKQNHVAHVRPACIHAMERVLGGSGWHDALVPLPRLSIHGSSGGGLGLDPIPSRRTAKQNYGEDQAKMWAEQEFPGALVEKVGSCVPKLGYDVRVALADGSELHIEAKYSQDDSQIMLSEGERAHNQDSGCDHEHVLYVVSGAQAIKVDGKWHCSGGTKIPYRNWNISNDDLTLVRSWRCKVPSH